MWKFKLLHMTGRRQKTGEKKKKVQLPATSPLSASAVWSGWPSQREHQYIYQKRGRISVRRAMSTEEMFATERTSATGGSQRCDSGSRPMERVVVFILRFVLSR